MKGNNNRNEFATGSLRALRGGLIAIVLMLAVLAGYKVNAVAQTTAASQTTPKKRLKSVLAASATTHSNSANTTACRTQGPLA